MPENSHGAKPIVAILNGLINSIPPIKGGGPQIVIWNTCEQLNQDRFDWFVLSNWDADLEALEYDKQRFVGVKDSAVMTRWVKLIGMLPFRVKKTIFGVVRPDHLNLNLKLVAELKRRKYNLIVVHDSYSLAFLCHLVFPTKPLVFYHHNSKMHLDLTEKRWNRLVRAANAGMISICQSAFTATNRVFKRRPKNNWVILNGVNENLIKQASMIKFDQDTISTEVKRELVFLYVGRITPIKGIDLLIQAAGEVIGKSPVPVRFVIVGSAGIDEGGDPAFELKMKELAEKLGQGRVQFEGFVPNAELAKYYSKSDFGILPTKLFEGNSLFLMECLTFGLPVIATRKGGVPEVVREGDDGILLDEVSLESELTPAMLKFINDRVLWDSKRAKIAKSAAQRFSYQRVAREFTQVVNQVLGDDK